MATGSEQDKKSQAASVRGSARARPTPDSPDDTGVVVVSPTGAALHKQFAVELVLPGPDAEAWREPLEQLRHQRCLPDPLPDRVAEHLAHHPVIVGWCPHGQAKKPMGALYLVPTTEWIASRDKLTAPPRKAPVPLSDAQYLNLVQFDCTVQAVEYRLSPRLIKEAFRLLPAEGPAGLRFVAHGPVTDLQRFCRRLHPDDPGGVEFFWNCMKQVAARSTFGRLSDLAGALGNVERLVGELATCDAEALARLRDRHGRALDRFLAALTRLFATVLYEPSSGDDLCLVSRFHRYHGGKLVDAATGSSLNVPNSLGVVLQFEYAADQIDRNRSEYQALRRSRRQPRPGQ